jgi:hypothetical protein
MSIAKSAKAKGAKAKSRKSKNGKSKNGIGVLFYVTPACDAFIDEARRREGKTRSQWFRHLLATHFNRPDLATMPEPGRPRASLHNARIGTKEQESR